MASSSVSTHAETSAVQAAAATADLQHPPTVPAIIKQLRALIDTLDARGTQSAAQVGASLQQLAQQLITLAPAASPPVTASAAAAEAAGTDADMNLKAACSESPAQGAGAAAATDVARLERSYEAPAVPGAADGELAALQPLTKKQRRGGKQFRVLHGQPLHVGGPSQPCSTVSGTKAVQETGPHAVGYLLLSGAARQGEAVVMI